MMPTVQPTDQESETTEGPLIASQDAWPNRVIGVSGWGIPILVVGLYLLYGLPALKVAFNATCWTAMTLLAVLPFSALLCRYSRSQDFGGGMLIITGLASYWVAWTWCAQFAFAYSPTWAFVGVLLLGYGLLPVAAVECVIEAKWTELGLGFALFAAFTLLYMFGNDARDRAARARAASSQPEVSGTLESAAEEVQQRGATSFRRWIAVLPGAILAGILTHFPVHWGVLYLTYVRNQPSSDLPISTADGKSLLSLISPELLEQWAVAWFVPIAVINAAAWIAPRHRIETAMLFGALIMLNATVGSLMLAFYFDASAVYAPRNVVGYILNIAAIFVALKMVMKRYE